MRYRPTLREAFVLVCMAAIVLPLSVYTIFFQMRTWASLNRYIENRMNQDLENKNMMVDLILDKYEMVLYDFCTDDEIVMLVEQIDGEAEASEESSRRLERELDHVYNRNETIEGITVLTGSGKVFLYDGGTSAPELTSWTGFVFPPQLEAEGTAYMGAGSLVRAADENNGLIQIARGIYDAGGKRRTGIVVLGISQKEFWEKGQKDPHSEMFLCDQDGKILAARQSEFIHENISSVPRHSRIQISQENERTGWMVHNFYSVHEFRQDAVADSAIWVLSSLTAMVLFAGLAWYLTMPLLNSIDDVEDAMIQVEEGNFQVRVERKKRLPKEMVRIIDGFNNMTEHTGNLVNQVRISMMEQKNAELSAMEAQMDPHFLYNTLDTINWKALEKEEYEISSMLGALADILRYSIRNPGDTVSISQELYWLDRYMMLQKEKLEGPLEVSVDVPEEILGCRIHKLLLQPFVENAIKHGFYHKRGCCRLKIRMGFAGQQIHITVWDNGRGIPAEMLEILNGTIFQDEMQREHVGIANVRKRLALYYGEEADLYFESEEGSYTMVHLFVGVLPALSGDRSQEGEVIG